ncbi:MAG: sulfotransferase family 2 domain-containing protein [Pseudomonadota bacterium]
MREDDFRWFYTRYRMPRWLPLRISLAAREATGIPKVFKQTSFSRNLVYIHIPKAGGSSIGHALFGSDRVGHYPYFVYKIRDADRFAGSLKFSVVRNPVSRLISAFDFIMTGGKGRADEKCRSAITSRIGTDASCEDFVLKVLDDHFLKDWVHFVPQHLFIFDTKRNLMVDFLLKQENLASDWIEFSETHGLSSELAVYNSRTAEPSQLSPSAIQRVEELYGLDFDLLGY